MAIGLSTFFGGGRDLGSVTTTVVLPQGCERVLRINSGVNAKIQLPNLGGNAIPRRYRRGFPHFIIVNVSATRPVSIYRYGETATALFTLAGARCVLIGIGHDNDWAFSDAKTYTLSGAL